MFKLPEQFCLKSNFQEESCETLELISNLQASLLDAIRALEFYSSERNYRWNSPFKFKDVENSIFPKIAIFDCGRVARDTLSRILNKDTNVKDYR